VEEDFQEVGMFGLQGWEWVVILVIVVLLFGIGRISKISGEVGSSIKAFKDGLKGDKDEEKKDDDKKEGGA
jgi:sec-independent protein translocase protein TatA